MNTRNSSDLTFYSKKKFETVKLLLLPAIVLFVFILIGSRLGPPFSEISRDKESPAMLSNPAAVYCQDMGYEYQTIKEAGGERGICHLPGEKICGAWEFLDGSCGQEYSFCAKQGYQIKTKSDGKNSYSSTYGVCLTEGGKELGSVAEMSQLTEKALGCQGKTPAQSVKPEIELDQVYVPSESALPASFDWRNNSGDWTTPIKDQGQCGSCWAFSAVGVAEAALNIEAGNPALDEDLSEQYLVSDCHTLGDGYGQLQTCCGGWKENALAYIRNYGIPDESCLPYVDGAGCACYEYCGDPVSCSYNSPTQCSDRTCSNRCGDWGSRLERITSLGTVNSDPATIKQALVDTGPLAVGIYIGGDFDGADIYRCEGGWSNHAVSIVGYNDAGGYWIVRNSWGTSWPTTPNDGGYFKVGYGECEIEEEVYYAVADAVTAPANDDMASAINITSLPYTNSQSSVGATLEEGEPDYVCAPGSSSVWYTYTPGSSGFYDVDTDGSVYNTVLHVYENEGGGVYSPVSCGDDFSDLQSRTIFYGESGTEYLIGITELDWMSVGSEPAVERNPDKVQLEPDQPLDTAGGDLTLSIDYYSCPADAICATVFDHSGVPLLSPELHVYNTGGIKVDETSSLMGGYVESDPLSPGTYNVDLTAENTFISESGWSLGYNAASAESLSATVITAEDQTSNPTIDGDVFLGKGETNDYVGGFWAGNSTTVYATPGTYKIYVQDWWDKDYALMLEGHIIGGGGGSITLDASLMPLDTVTFYWDGVSLGSAWIPAFENYLFQVSWLSDGHTIYVSNPDTSYTLGAELIKVDGLETWYYSFFDCCQVTGSPDQNVSFTIGGTLSTDLSAQGEPYSPGDIGSLLATVEDAYSNLLEEIRIWIGGVGSTSDEREDDNQFVKNHLDPTGDERVYLPSILDKDLKSSSDGNLYQSGWTSTLPDYQVEDALSDPILGSLAYSDFRAPFEFDIPDPANLGTWQGEVTVEFGPYQTDGTDTVSFDVVEVFDKISMYSRGQKTWYLKDANNDGWGNVTTVRFGSTDSSWIPVVGDWNGNGTDTIAMYSRSQKTWYLKDTNTDGWGDVSTVRFGSTDSSWIPVVGDWNGNGTDTIAMYSRSQKTWYLKDTNTDGWGGITTVRFGSTDSSWIPVVGDWNGNGTDTIAMYSRTQKTWYLKGGNTDGWGDVSTVRFGSTDSSWIPVAGDWDGDSTDTIGMYSRTQKTWYLKGGNTDGWGDVSTVRFGSTDTSWVPVTGTW